MTDIDDKLLEQQKQEQREQDNMNPQFKGGDDAHDKEESETVITDEELKEYQDQEEATTEQDRECEKGGDGNGNDKGNSNNQARGDAEDRRSVAEILVDLALKNIQLFFKNQYGIAHALVKFADHQEITRVESGRFKRYLGRLYYEEEYKVANTEAITNAINVLQAKAEHEGQTIHLSLRVAWHDGNIYYDMTNEKWQCVKISKGDWQLLQSNEIPLPMFMRYNQSAQVQPTESYEENIMEKFLQSLTNIKDEKNKLLLKVYIVSLFVPDIPHVMMILHGKMGSAKSTLQTLIKLVVDPATPKLLTIYNDVKEFIQQLAHTLINS